MKLFIDSYGRICTQEDIMNVPLPEIKTNDSGAPMFDQKIASSASLGVKKSLNLLGQKEFLFLKKLTKKKIINKTKLLQLLMK